MKYFKLFFSTINKFLVICFSTIMKQVYCYELSRIVGLYFYKQGTKGK